jgi:formate C-acetyltransferase
MGSKLPSMDRRFFLKSVCAGTGLAAGAAVTSRASVAEGPSASKSTASAWGMPWRPDVPKRLSEHTRELARAALNGDHGRVLAKDLPPLPFDQTYGRTKNEAYALAAKHAAQLAPLRILPGELIVGSATIHEAALHAVPFLGVSSTSHTTLGWDKVLKSGYVGLRARIEERLARGFDDEPGSPAAPPPLPEIYADCPEGKVFQCHPGAGYWLEQPSSEALCNPPLSVRCRAKLNSTTNFNLLVLNKSKDSRDHWELYSYTGSGCLSAYLPGYTPSEIVSDAVITDGQWHDIAMEFEPDRVRLYVDGALVKEKSIQREEKLGEGSGGFCIGGLPNALGCDGSIASVRIESAGTTLLNWTPDSQEAGPQLRYASILYGTIAPQNKGRDQLEAMLGCLDAAEIWRQRHLDLLDERIAQSEGDERAIYTKVRANLSRVPEHAPETFHEAVQSLWFMYAFHRLMGTWSGIGRIDEMLGPYLDKDLQAGRITIDEAREILAHFWVKGCEWIGSSDFGGSGDAQFYQNIILSGIDTEGRDVTNIVTYLVLDIVEELHISDFPIAVRINQDTPKALLRRVAEVQRHGGGIVALYNEEVVIDGLVKFGYALEDARRFTNDGCWETLVPGETCFIYSPFDALALLQEVIGVKTLDAPVPEFATFDDLYVAYVARLGQHVEAHRAMAPHHMRSDLPAPLVSMFVDDCIESGRSYYDRGARYTVLACHAGGMANVANSLLVLKRLVYESEYLSLADFVSVLRQDWDGAEHLRRLVQKRFTFYGNDEDAADEMMNRVFTDFTELMAQCRERDGVWMPAGISTFGREIGWAGEKGGRSASPDGHHRDDVLATNCSPSPGTDIEGPTAVLKSYCKLDFTRSPNGATVELKVHPESVKGDEGVEALAALMSSFVRLGGWFLHIDVVDSALLIDAQKHPEKYPNLSVRIAGWSARFATLSKEWQDMVISRSQQYV